MTAKRRRVVEKRLSNLYIVINEYGGDYFDVIIHSRRQV